MGASQFVRLFFLLEIDVEFEKVQHMFPGSEMHI